MHVGTFFILAADFVREESMQLLEPLQEKTFLPPQVMSGHPYVEMYSFDHDLEEFVAIGLGTVAEDGSIIKTNSGIGVIKAGWHCGSQPAGQGCTHICKDNVCNKGLSAKVYT